MLPKTNRLTRNKNFGMVFKKGKSFKEDSLILKFVWVKRKNCRFGIVVSQKVSKKAVVRNKIKRRIRAIIKPLMSRIEKGADAVLVTLPGFETENFLEMQEVINKLFKKAKLISDARLVAKIDS